MRINTRTDSLELTKREHQTLADAKSLLLQISKHGSGEMAENAAQAAEDIGVVQSNLKPPSADLPGQKNFIEEGQE